MSKREQALVIDPKAEIHFRGPYNRVVTEYFNIKNPTEKWIAFKVKTTAPKRYCVRPNNGTLKPGGSVSVAVMLQPLTGGDSATGGAAANSAAAANIEKNKHKFMIQSVFSAITDGTANADDLFKQASPDDIMDSKFRCVFDDSIGVTTSAASGANTGAGNVASGGAVNSTPAHTSDSEFETGLYDIKQSSAVNDVFASYAAASAKKGDTAGDSITSTTGASSSTLFESMMQNGDDNDNRSQSKNNNDADDSHPSHSHHPHPHPHQRHPGSTSASSITGSVPAAAISSTGSSVGSLQQQHYKSATDLPAQPSSAAAAAPATLSLPEAQRRLVDENRELRVKLQELERSLRAAAGAGGGGIGSGGSTGAYSRFQTTPSAAGSSSSATTAASTSSAAAGSFSAGLLDQPLSAQLIMTILISLLIGFLFGKLDLGLF